MSNLYLNPILCRGGEHTAQLSPCCSGEAGLSKEREITIIVCQSDSKLLCSVNAGAFECFQFYYYCKARGGPGPSLREQFLFTANNDTKWRGLGIQLHSDYPHILIAIMTKEREKQMWNINTS